MASDVFQSAQDKDNELRVKVSQAREHAATNPNDHDAQIELVNVCEEGKKLWETCERDLSRLDQATTDGDEHAMLVREINMARNLAKAYGTEAADASSAAASTAKKGLFGMGAKKPKATQPKATQPKAQKANDIPLAIRLAIAAFAIAVLVSFMGKKSESKPTPESASESAPTEQIETTQESEQAPEPESEPEPEPTEQVLFDGDTMRVTFRDWKEEPYVNGCCYLYLGVENKTGSEVWFHAAYGTSSVNGYNGMFAQGMPTYVQAGNKAIMGIILTYKQFGVSSFDEVHTCDFDLVQEDKNNYGSEFARAHIHVER